MGLGALCQQEQLYAGMISLPYFARDYQCGEVLNDLGRLVMSERVEGLLMGVTDE